MAKEEPTIRQEYNPKGKELDVLKHSYDRFYTIKDSNQRSQLVPKWDTWMKNWEAWRPSKPPESWQSNYFIPLTTTVVETILSEMVDQSPRPIIMARSPEDQTKATVMQHLFNYTWELANGDIELYNWIKDILIFGTGIVQEHFFQDRRMIKMPVSMNKKKKIKYEEKEVLEFDGSYMESCSIYDIYVDELAREFNRGFYKARDVYRRMVMSEESFHDFFSGRVWNPLGNAKFVKKASGDTNYYEFFKPPESDLKGDEVEVLWGWERKPEDALMVVANGIVIKMGPNPHRHKQLPFAKGVDVTRPHQFYCKGEPELLDSIQEEQNLTRRMWADRSHLDLDKMFLVSNRETLDDRDLIARPHGVIPVDDPNSVKPVEYGDIPRSTQILQDEMNKDAIKVTGIDDRFQSARSISTATEAAIVKESTLRRIRMKLRMFEKGALVDVGRLRVANIIQFYTQPKIEKIVGEKGKGLEQRVSQAKASNRLLMQDGVPYEKKFMQIRIPGKRLGYDESGKLFEETIKGNSFFEAKPGTFVPSAASFDIRFEAGSTMPVSKPLLQTKTMEMFDRLAPLALQGIGGYSITKLADKYIESLEFSPEEFKEGEQQTKTEESRMGNIVEMAVVENEMLIKGKSIPPNGTPYATPGHTEIHIALIKSPKIQTAEPKFRTLLKHILGEVASQEKRQESEGAATQMPGAPPSPESGSAPNINKQMKDTMPGRVQGGGEVPEQPGSRGLLSGVKNFFRGGA